MKRSGNLYFSKELILSRELFGLYREKAVYWPLFAGLLMVVFDRITRAFNRFRDTRAVALGICKTFDRIWHAGLLQKRKSCGISGQLFILVSSFLSNRRLRVVLGGKGCKNAVVSHGSILGLVLHFFTFD